MGEKFLNSTILTYILSKIKDLLSTKADKANVDNLIDGTTAAGKATKDAEGNVIHETYVTEEQLEEMIGQGGGGGGIAFNGDANNVNYDNTFSGLMATDVQTAIDELALGGGSGGSVPDGVTYVSFDESGEHTGIVAPVNADTLGGHPVDYFATAEDLEDLNIDIENVDGLVYVDGEITETDYYVPINADLLDGYKASDFVTVESLGSLSNGQLTAAKAIADKNGNVIHTTYVTETKVNQMIQNATGGTADVANNALALNGHPASYFATATQLTDILNQAKTYAKTYADELVNGYLNGKS